MGGGVVCGRAFYVPALFSATNSAAGSLGYYPAVSGLQRAAVVGNRGKNTYLTVLARLPYYYGYERERNQKAPDGYSGVGQQAGCLFVGRTTPPFGRRVGGLGEGNRACGVRACWSAV